MNFSEREGRKKPKHNSLESIDTNLKNAIWTVIYNHISNSYISWGITGYNDNSYKGTKAANLWTDFFIQKINSLPSAEKYLAEIEKLYVKLEWHEVYDLIEFFLEQNKYINPAKFNKVLIRHNATYRVIDSIVQPISDKGVIAAMESANNNSLSEEIKEHLHKAQTLYSSRQQPDFNNSCLESIKAVEGTCRVILNNTKILGENIKELNKSKNHNQHIISALKNINAFRGNDVAHAKKENSHTLTIEDAILIHTICCGFINYFKSKKQDK